MGPVNDAGETLVQHESRYCEAYETEGGQETEKAVDEDSATPVLFRMMTEFDGESPRDMLNFWLEFFSIFNLEMLFDNFTRRDEVNEEEKCR